jgi:hypothetical protein
MRGFFYNVFDEFCKRNDENGYTRCKCKISISFPLNRRYIPAAKEAPRSGPRIGTHEYFQSLSRFPGMGRRKCIIRGPRSRAGFIA